jgi:hypothetical protein
MEPNAERLLFALPQRYLDQSIDRHAGLGLRGRCCIGATAYEAWTFTLDHRRAKSLVWVAIVARAG